MKCFYCRYLTCRPFASQNGEAGIHNNDYSVVRYSKPYSLQSHYGRHRKDMNRMASIHLNTTNPGVRAWACTFCMHTVCICMYAYACMLFSLYACIRHPAPRLSRRSLPRYRPNRSRKEQNCFGLAFGGRPTGFWGFATTSSRD